MCVVLNEAEVLIDNVIPQEPEIEKVIVRRERPKGKRDLNLKDIEVEIIQHDCTQEELQAHFPKGWHVLEDEVYKELQYIPSCFKVLEHHVKVYAGNHDSGQLPCAQKHRTVFFPTVSLLRNWPQRYSTQSM